ncbi:MAG: UDP-N-acetylmuramate-L-alanine ligase, UDP-N-acetylmuramate-alanine ligase [Candidatus Peregrinibacteria bacterium GW2011_GWF2_43_17]|nr:MAG: UDP-N-acetylmuramate-L-alanine ligase, UDP-N-acetylmuramate-alanine ligase [Candidatus Peregrinibacteria bacterium GW2011_GWF2_43_17]KKT20006.1 MAG: UDP-N-acetylmuramate-L-alanine ligase [Candidatus Peregrinibacteria bacterium GW2011_GWA2_43_8]HAU39626.1 UDP-N-acetylmuramate--L-alanine ligase [Candidatus Peregrinibacteria bacterium]
MHEFLDKIKFKDIKKAFFVGVGGRGVSALARILKSRGVECIGSDKEDSDSMKELRNEGITCFVGHKAEYVPNDTDLMVVTFAVMSENPEWTKGRELKIPVLTYPEGLGVLSREFKTIAITGTHGKTTTTLLTALGMMEGKVDTSCVLGAPVPEFDGKNCLISGSDKMIIEACEYRRAFLNLKVEVAVITNVDWDHTDYYKTEEDFMLAFKQLVRGIPSNGLVIANIDDKWTREVIKDAICRVVTFGEDEKADFRLKGNELWEDGRKLGELKVGVPGRHNQYNAAAAFAVCRFFGVEPGVLFRTFELFQGTYRRFDLLGKMSNGALVYNDYAHHPTAVMATLSAARDAFPGKKIVMAIQPHQYNRTWVLLDRYATAFKDADLVVVPNIYEARDTEEDKAAVSPTSFCKVVEKGSGCPAIDGQGFENSAKLIKSMTDENSVVFTTGTGDINKLAKMLVE